MYFQSDCSKGSEACLLHLFQLVSDSTEACGFYSHLEGKHCALEGSWQDSKEKRKHFPVFARRLLWYHCCIRWAGPALIYGVMWVVAPSLEGTQSPVQRQIHHCYTGNGKLRQAGNELTHMRNQDIYRILANGTINLQPLMVSVLLLVKHPSGIRLLVCQSPHCTQ